MSVLNNETVKLFTHVKEVYETSDEKKVNALIKESWILLHIAVEEENTYCLGRLDSGLIELIPCKIIQGAN